jgi:GxxExxY protein
LEIDRITESIIGAAIDVHRELGPGLLESTYQACLAYELALRGLKVEREKAIDVTYKNSSIDCSYRVDLLVENCVIVEVKSAERLDPVHAAQVLTYLKLSGHQVGLLMNFNVVLLKDGVRRMVLGLPESPRHRRQPT